MKTKITILGVLLCLCFNSIFAQKQQNDWNYLGNKRTTFKKETIKFNSLKMPTTFKLYSLNIASIKTKLQGAPVRGTFFGKSPTIPAPTN